MPCSKAMRLSSKIPSANSSTASLHSGSPTLQHNLPSSAPHLDQNKPGCGSGSSWHLHTKPRNHHSTALCQLLYLTKPGGKALCAQGCCPALCTAQCMAAPALQTGKTQAMAAGRLETRQHVYLAVWISQWGAAASGRTPSRHAQTIRINEGT